MREQMKLIYIGCEGGYLWFTGQIIIQMLTPIFSKHPPFCYFKQEPRFCSTVPQKTIRKAAESALTLEGHASTEETG